MIEQFGKSAENSALKLIRDAIGGFAALRICGRAGSGVFSLFSGHLLADTKWGLSGLVQGEKARCLS
jgi:hypothetical protein